MNNAPGSVQIFNNDGSNQTVMCHWFNNGNFITKEYMIKNRNGSREVEQIV